MQCHLRIPFVRRVSPLSAYLYVVRYRQSLLHHRVQQCFHKVDILYRSFQLALYV